jgi:hypothetical protein
MRDNEAILASGFLLSYCPIINILHFPNGNDHLETTFLTAEETHGVYFMKFPIHFLLDEPAVRILRQNDDGRRRYGKNTGSRTSDSECSHPY